MLKCPPKCGRTATGTQLEGNRALTLLEPGPHRRDAVRIETEPMHPADVPSVLDLDAAVHDDGYTAVLCDPRSLLVDDTELAPQGPGVDGYGISSDAGQGVRSRPTHGAGHWVP